MSEVRICPFCGSSVTKLSPAESDEMFALNLMYYELGDGVVWAPPKVRFRSEESVKRFTMISDFGLLKWEVSYG